MAQSYSGGGGGGKVRVKARALVNITSLLPPSLSPALTDQTITGISNGKLAGNLSELKTPNTSYLNI